MTTVVLAPMLPAPTGNGLAMRIGAQLRALAAGEADLRLIVVPLAGGSSDDSWARGLAASVDVLPAGDDRALRSAAARLLAGDAWRPLRDARVHAIRIALAPLALAIADRFGTRATLDLDDDEEPALVARFGPSFRWLSLAAPEDAARVALRSGLPTVVLPNSIDVPTSPPGRTRRSGPASLLYVGNLTYPPNIEAAETLAREIAPRVRSFEGTPVVADLVGPHETPGPVASLAALPGTVVHGFVADLEDRYACASVVVVPLRHGSGTRIKLLEALADGVPVVSSTLGAAGLGLTDGEHVLLADDVGDQARAVGRILASEALAARLVANGRALVEQRYGSEVVAATIRALVLGTPLSR
jgi:glycosyltransferase involved in cell wall biosynthesis